MNSYYKCASGGRTVTVWPSTTGETGFYDVVISVDRWPDATRTVSRITAFEAASYVVTELGAPLSLTLNALTGMIERWRAELDMEMASVG